MGFADIGDRVTPVRRRILSLEVGGPEAGPLAGLGDENLVLRAARLYIEAARDAGDPRGGAGPMRGAALIWTKRLPAASGIGGGSSDAAASTAGSGPSMGGLLARRRFAELALRLGADVPACLGARPVWVGGIGERLEPAADLPTAGIVLANPRSSVADTRRCFAAGVGRFRDRAVYRDVGGCRGLPRRWRPAATT